MMKKSELIEALNQGCYIYLDDANSRAIVYSNTDERIDSCRYDTAERLVLAGNYNVINLGVWSYARRIENTAAREAAREAAAEELEEITTPGTIRIKAKNDCRIGQNYVGKGRTYIITVYGDGSHDVPGNAYGKLYDFRADLHAVYFDIIERPQSAEELDAESARVEAATREALARAGMLAQDNTNTENEEESTMKTRKSYLNHRTEETTASATQAMQWHRAGDLVQVNTYYNEPGRKTGLANVVHVPGAAQETERREDENRAHCKHIAQELDAYVNDEVKRCPECGEIHRRDWGQVGDLFKCPNCGEVTSVDDWEWLSIWDFLSDVFDVEYRCGSDRELRSVRVMVACGGPNIYLDSASKDVELYWWNERARYPMSYEAAEALDQWGEDCWNM